MESEKPSYHTLGSKSFQQFNWSVDFFAKPPIVKRGKPESRASIFCWIDSLIVGIFVLGWEGKPKEFL